MKRDDKSYKEEHAKKRDVCTNPEEEHTHISITISLKPEHLMTKLLADLPEDVRTIAPEISE